ncbi:MAG TPA: chromosome partitioning protein ParA, partial [Rhodospirillales bacterium]|nr:chromosome partitioning protein ParA [Rhodospirillales bacterium]
LEDGKTRLNQITADIGRERAMALDAATAAKRLEKERAETLSAAEGEDEALSLAKDTLAKANEAVQALEKDLAQLTERVAANEARRDSLSRKLTELRARKERLSVRATEIAGQRARLEAERGDARKLIEAEETLAERQAALERSRARAIEAETARLKAAEETARVVSQQHDAEAAMTRLSAEEHALAKLLETDDQNMWPPLIDAVTVTPGFEAALGIALGEDLSAPTDELAPVRWQTLSPFDAVHDLPEGAEPLALFVKGPAALTRRLTQIGVVATEDSGKRLAPSLHQGQRLVSRDGAFWRWDGYMISKGAQTAATARLEQRNRLKDVRAKLEDANARVLDAKAKTEQAREAAQVAGAAEHEAREAVQSADRLYSQARDALSDVKEKAAQTASQLDALSETAAAVAADLEETEISEKDVRHELDGLPDPGGARDHMGKLRADLSTRRAVQLERRSGHDNLIRAADERRRRLAGVHGELESWKNRGKNADEHIGRLMERKRSVTGELDALSARPAEIAERRTSLLEHMERSEEKRKLAADALAEAETRLAEAESQSREKERQLVLAREQRIRAEGRVEHGKQTCKDIGERVAERLDCAPSDLKEMAELKEENERPELEAVERRVERLNRERETMGPVNLRAEQEADELTEQIATLDTERKDLLAAIDKLRQGITELNHEGRQRLLASFKDVDRHFQELFVRLFGGGRAHLELIDSDDPLEAGLEIMASPPGKRLQVLSLLSGGEQALTALSLLFGVFLTNPAPICVLDEVDAPLDDANVDRVCTMLDEMAHGGRTRFLVITHHRMTMARMDRLFGVTMAERGVSQLVSVDLQKAEILRATA